MCCTCGYAPPPNEAARPLQLTFTSASLPRMVTVAMPEALEWFRGFNVVWYDVPLWADAGAAIAVNGRAAAASGTRTRVVVRMAFPSVDEHSQSTGRRTANAL